MTSRVLVVDDDSAVRDVIVSALTEAGYRCIEAIDGNDALAKARAFSPDLVVLDVIMPGLTGDQVQRELRRSAKTRYLPVIFVTGQGEPHAKAQRLLEGADDYITKPFVLEEVVARVATALRRSRELRALNPLSGLPGNVAIANEIQRHLLADDAAACIYCDLDHFKDFNDHYGFARGDQLIVELARLLTSLAESCNDAFVGHVGGDDFVIVAPEQEAIDLARQIVRGFDALAPTFYDAADRARGGVLRIDRRGVEREMPFVTVSLGIVAISPSRFTDSVGVSRAAAEVKEIAKRRDESSWAIDRRRTPDVVEARAESDVRA